MPRGFAPLVQALAPAGDILRVALLVLLMAPSVLAQASDDDEGMSSYEAQAKHGPSYPIGQLDLRYLRENPLHPPLSDVMDVTFELGEQPTGYTVPEEGMPTVTMSFAEIERRPVETYHASAVQHMLETLRDWLTDQDLLGVYVAPDPAQLSVGRDMRAPGQTSMTFIVATGTVTSMRTLATGDRVGEKSEIKPEDRINNPVHARILKNSPIRPYTEGDGDRSDLIRKTELDDYLFWLGRHPGRRVDASLAPGENEGVDLDYLVTENRPLVLYAQISNTGTPTTERLRQRFGLQHTQLTNSDDILTIDYTTGNFSEFHSVLAAYERPLWTDRVRGRILGAWQTYNATNLGFFNDIFEGDQWTVSGEIIGNFYQNRELFLDAVGGLRYDSIEVDNQAFGIQSDGDFLIPYVGMRLDRTTEWFATRAELIFDFGFSVSGDTDSLARLGRVLPDDDWVTMRWNMSHSFYVEPALDRAAWEDPTTPGSSRLVNEILLQFRGQYAFDNRLVPQYQDVLGGLYTVRGYPQSVVAGDTAYVVTLEYRLHVPQAFEIEPEPRDLFGRPFRFAPQYLYGRPDWDLVLKAFLDVGQTFQSDALPFESDETLVGIGVGFDVIFKRNIKVRVDWGFVLKEIESRDVNTGSNRLNFVATLFF